jgi:hypothetical protein
MAAVYLIIFFTIPMAARSRSVEDLTAKAYIQLNCNLLDCAVETVFELFESGQPFTPEQELLLEHVLKARISRLRQFMNETENVRLFSKAYTSLIGFSAQVCRLIDGILARRLGPASRCFFLRTRADFVRYCCEANPAYIDATNEAAAIAYRDALAEAELPDVVAVALRYYKEAAQIGEETVGSAYLSAVWNYAVFLRGLGESPAEAVAIADAALQKYVEAQDRDAPDDGQGDADAEAEAGLRLFGGLGNEVEKWRAEASQ